ncbi:LysR family transcriptional regulator [Cohaesibacter haloalkalitolerans]|uniref:LysR family transcriptional regulator n=1 Tax=Cohaesibacter haloalkalitolerans TaxID=1162980 RepID=UPI000E65031E|nr:LysR family transcriptional regulator [Cohaesibacter haloalkalitolerans]
MLTLRQIEVIRAIMVAGTVKGAAELLNVSAPGISRVMKYTEDQLGIRLFSRIYGRYTPTEEARDIFEQIASVFHAVENLHQAIDGLKRGEKRCVSFGAVPSIAHHVLPSAVRALHEQFPGLELHLNTIKIEEAIDYLLLQKGELVAMSYKLDHPGLSVQPLYSGQLFAILPANHPLGDKENLSVRDLARERLVGIEPSDPYGKLLMAPFVEAGLDVSYSIVARTGQTVSTLVAQGLGVAIMDELSLAGPQQHPSIIVRRLAEPTSFRTYAVFSADQPRSIFADAMVKCLIGEMKKAAAERKRLSPY